MEGNQKQETPRSVEALRHLDELRRHREIVKAVRIVDSAGNEQDAEIVAALDFAVGLAKEKVKLLEQLEQRDREIGFKKRAPGAGGV